MHPKLLMIVSQKRKEQIGFKFYLCTTFLTILLAAHYFALYPEQFPFVDVIPTTYGAMLFGFTMTLGIGGAIVFGIAWSVLHNLFKGEYGESHFDSFLYHLAVLPFRATAWLFSLCFKKQRNSKPSAADLEWGRQQADRESEAKTKKQRIEKARFDVQLLHDQYASKIGEKFPDDKLAKYFEEYMNDELDTETVEQRGRDLQEMILGLAKPTENKKKVVTPETIREHYDRQRKQLDALGLEADARENQLVELNYQEDQALSDYFRNS